MMQIDIKKTCKRYGISLQQLADAMGISRQGLTYHQQRGNCIEVATLERMAEIIGCQVSEFFYQDDGNVDNSFHCPHCGKRIMIIPSKEKE